MIRRSYLMGLNGRNGAFFSSAYTFSAMGNSVCPS